MLKIVISGYDSASNERLNGMIGEFFSTSKFDYRTIIFCDFMEFYTTIDNGFRFHIALIDIFKHEAEGMKLSRLIRRYDKDCVIIFISVTAEYAIAGYSVHAFDYIIKPLEKCRVFTAISEALMRFDDIIVNELSIKTKGANVRIKCSDIKYIESFKHYLRFHMENGEQYRVYAKLDEYEKTLKAHKAYIRCHQSFLVNMNYVKNVSGRDFVMNDYAKIPIRRSSIAKLKREYYKYNIENRI
jgi:two-component system response regulator LytT